MSEQTFRTPPSTSSWRMLGYISISLFVVALVIVASFPTFLTTKIGTKLVCNFLSKKLRGTVEIESLQLGWFTHQAIAGFEYKSGQNDVLFSFESLQSESSLWDILLSRKFDAKTTFISPHVEIYQHQKEATSSSTGAPLALLLAQNLHLEDGMITVIDPHQTKTTFQNVSLDIQTEKDFIQLTTKGNSLFNDIAGTFSLLTSFHTKNKETLFTNFKKELLETPLELEIATNRFPVAGLDQILTMVNSSNQGFLTSIFGNSLNLTATINTTSPKHLIAIDALSPGLKASIHTQSIATGLLLTQDSYLALNVQPSFYKSFFKVFNLSKNISLSKSALVKASALQLFIPKNGQNLAFNNISFSLLFEVSQLGLFLEDAKQSLVINSLVFNTQTKNLEEKLDVAVQGSLNYQMKNPSMINFSFSVNHFLSQLKKLQHDLFSSFQLDISKFPLPFIDSFFGMNKKLSWFLGDVLNLKIQSRFVENKIRYFVKASTPLLDLPELCVAIDESIYLEKPASFHYQLNQDVLAFFASYPYFKTINFRNIAGNIEGFGLSLENLSKRNFNDLVMQLRLNTNDFDVTSAEMIGYLQVFNHKVHINVESLEKVFLKFFVHAEYPNTEKFRHLIYGKYIDLETDVNLDLGNFDNIFASSCTGFIKSDRVLLDYGFSLLDNLSKIVLTKPIEGAVLPSPELLNTFFRPEEKFITYNPYLPLEVRIQAEPLYIHKPLFDHLIFDAKFFMQKFDFVNRSWIEEFSLEDIEIHISGDSKKKKFQSELKSVARSKGVTAGFMKASMESNAFDSLDFYRKESKTAVTFDQFSLRFLTSLLGADPRTNQILGDQFNFHLSLNSQNSITKSQVDFHTTRLDFQWDLIFKDKISLGSKPLTLDLFLPEDGYDVLQRLALDLPSSSQTPFSIESPMIFHFKVKDFECPDVHDQFLSDPTQRLKHLMGALRQSHFDLNLLMENTIIRSNLYETRTAIDAIKMSIIKKEDNTPAFFNFIVEAKDLSKQTYNKKGLVSATGQMMLPYYGQKSDLNGELNLTLNSFPTLIFDSFAKIFMTKQLSPSLYLGQSLTGHFKTTLLDDAGPISLKLDSVESKVSAVGTIEDGVLRLSEPLYSSLKITPALSSYVQKEMNVQSLTTQKPITLNVSDKGFFFKVFPYDISSLVIRDANLDLGQVFCTNTGNIQDISGIFKQKASPSSQINIWFQPMPFSVRGGTLNINRTEFLYNKSLELALWGKVDLVKEYVKMVLGLTEQSLRTAFGIKGLPRSYVLQIPVEGPYGNIKINKEMATTRIALLLAKVSGLTKQAGPFGNVVDLLGDLAGDQKSVPPARRPFPWEKELSELEELRSQKNTVQIIR